MKDYRMVFLALMVGGLVFLAAGRSEAGGFRDEEVLASATQTKKDADGQVRITVQWLRRPGEMALLIEYFGYLTQEGTVNFFLDLNGTRREFVTFREELPNRAQRIRILSFHPSINDGGVNKLKCLPSAELVDYRLFRNAPYYPQFGKVRLELKFFANGRWDGDSTRGNENYQFEFDSPIKAAPADHF